MTLSLNTRQVTIPPHPQVTPPTQYVTIPTQYVTIPKPLSYEFRVAETVDEDGKVLSVKLQMQIWEHDEYGAGTVRLYWQDVPRVKFDKHGAMLATP